ncbi:SAV_6107 family HEPN domain-containing protein [Hamadaea tsunoensis]|uniref:SAV_6107 family HEPN domain-containing protein n=1 Tax=Hamadaea tsunoensis TaxID=53368 RepID=UPI00146FAAF0|nr:SAV_6107 family HEPN domain-containing protein [Hamadaea tsunoensis]
MTATTISTATGPVTGSATSDAAYATPGSPVGVAAHLLPHRTPVELVLLARRGLGEAALTMASSQRYATAHLAALRAAAAVLAVRARPVTAGRRRGARVTSAWLLLTKVAPELGEWAAFFAAGAAKRSAAEAGIARVTPREADDLLRAAGQFIDLVQAELGLHPDQRPEGIAGR